MIYIDPLFLDLASKLGISSPIAEQLFVLLKNKKSTQIPIVKISKELGITINDASKKVIQLKKAYRDSLVLKDNHVNNIDLVSEARQALEYQIGKLHNPVTPKKVYKDKQIIDVISDLHFPFADQKAITKLLENPGDELWIVGDILDFYSVSRHRKELDYVLVREEFAQARAFLEVCSSIYQKIYIISGNHDSRMIKQIQDLLPALLSIIVDPLVTLTNGLANVEILSTEVDGTSPNGAYEVNHKMGYLGQVNNALLCHFENFCGKEAPEKVLDFLNDFSHLLDLKPYDIILQGHTHRLGMNYTPKGQLLVSTGCMCRPMPYIFAGHGKYPAPTTGFVKLTRYSDKVSLNETQIIKV